ncbi:hypothetical protein ACOMHN_037521 [Nucella lapillus]
MSDNKSSGSEEKIFIKVLGLTVEDVQNWTPPSSRCHRHYEVASAKNRFLTVPATPSPLVSTEGQVGQRTQKGYLVCVNDQLIALFKVQGRVYAIDDTCPHAGGPLSMGDIEDLPEEGLCVRCPWHKWGIMLDSGAIGEHKGHKQRAKVYPVRVTDGGDIYIGFDQVSQHFFDIDKHPSVDPCS